MGVCSSEAKLKQRGSIIVEGPITQITTTQSEYIQCSLCKIVDEGPFIMLKCTHYYHQKCFSKQIIQQIEVKQILIIKCFCGSKTTTNHIRNSNLPDKLILLNLLFTHQLKFLLDKLRKKEDYNCLKEQFEYSKQHGDYYYFQNKKQLEYEETPE